MMEISGEALQALLNEVTYLTHTVEEMTRVIAKLNLAVASCGDDEAVVRADLHERASLRTHAALIMFNKALVERKRREQLLPEEVLQKINGGTGSEST